MVKTYNGETYVIPKAFEDEIRADERKKFAEWLVNKSAYTHIEYGKIGYQSDSDYCEMCWKSVDEVLAEYEKEQKK